MGRQGIDQVAEQQTVIHLDESLVRAERIGYRKLGKGIDNDGGGSLIAIKKTGKISAFGTSAAEEQLVGEQLLFAIKDRLSSEKDVLQFRVRHGSSLRFLMDFQLGLKVTSKS